MAAPGSTNTRPAPGAPSPAAQREAIVRAFTRAMRAPKLAEACAKLRDRDAHHFADVGADADADADADRATMASQAGACERK
jgi:hypothetical protein